MLHSALTAGFSRNGFSVRLVPIAAVRRWQLPTSSPRQLDPQLVQSNPLELSLKQVLGLFNPFRLVGKDGLSELAQ